MGKHKIDYPITNHQSPITNHQSPIMNTWFSTLIPNYTLSTSSNNNLLLPGLPETPMTPTTQNPQANPPMVFIPKYSQFKL